MSAKTKTDKETVIAIDLGTYCDNRLAEIALSRVVERYHVVYITDHRHNINTDKFTKSGYATPDFFINDPQDASNPKVNFALWVLMHPKYTFEASMWARHVRSLLHKAIAKYKPICLIIMYPALSTVWLLGNEVTLPIFVLYVAPAIVSYNLPWLFDSDMEDAKTNLYEYSKANKDSGMTYLQRIARMGSVFGNEPIMDLDPFNKFRKLHHVVCYDKNIVPQLKHFKQSSLKITNVGGLLGKDIGKPPRIDKNTNLFKFMDDCKQTRSDIIFLTFGSYGGVPAAANASIRLLELLPGFCAANNAKVLFHNGGVLSPSQSRHIRVINGFVPYETIVKKAKLVIFTGSVCLQNICLYNATPMLFFPILSEQFFWAKNYTYHTRVPFINYHAWEDTLQNNDSFATIVKLAMRRNAFLKLVCRSMRSYGCSGAPRRILALVDASRQLSQSRS